MNRHLLNSHCASHTTQTDCALSAGRWPGSPCILLGPLKPNAELSKNSPSELTRESGSKLSSGTLSTHLPTTHSPLPPVVGFLHHPLGHPPSPNHATGNSFITSLIKRRDAWGMVEIHAGGLCNDVRSLLHSICGCQGYTAW